MSRMFNALQEAARFREGLNGSPGEAVWKELGIDSAAVLDVQKGDASVAARADADGVLEAPASVPPVGAVPQLTPVDGRPTRLLLDKRARAIPHTADPIVVERYRMLRTKILQEREKKFFRSLVITSASPQEGKTVTVMNLALSFAALPSFKILVVDGDMRRGSLGDWLGIDKKIARG